MESSGHIPPLMSDNSSLCLSLADKANAFKCVFRLSAVQNNYSEKGPVHAVIDPACPSAAFTFSPISQDSLVLSALQSLKCVESLCLGQKF